MSLHAGLWIEPLLLLRLLLLLHCRLYESIHPTLVMTPAFSSGTPSYGR